MSMGRSERPSYIEIDGLIYIEKDMNDRNSISKRKKDEQLETSAITLANNDNSKTRKKREELSVSACKCIKKENVKIIVSFN